MTLANWLSKAAVEEQTSVLLLVLKVNQDSLVNIQSLRCLNWHITKYYQTFWLNVLQVLCHLPLHKALPIHISTLLQSVNRLRFYRSSGVTYLFQDQIVSNLNFGGVLFAIAYKPNNFAD